MLEKFEEGIEHARKVLQYKPNDAGMLENIATFEKLIAQKGLKTTFSNDKPTAYFYVGLSSERWTSDSVNNGGIGGRETSNIYMAKEFQKLGWNVTLFSDCHGMEGEYDGVPNVDYRRFYDVCQKHKPDVVFSSGRFHIFDEDFPATMKVAWVHDLGWGNSLEEWFDYLTDERRDKLSTIISMSPFQMEGLISQYSIPKELFYLSRSGIKVEERFSKKVERNRHRLIYTSSADRGLERLLDYWPAIRTYVPDAELHIFYGFLNAIVGAKSRSEEQGKKMEEWVNGLTAKMEQLPGVEFHDRIPQDQLAVEFQKSSVWAYPTHFCETMCLSALEASAAGCAVVTTDMGALHTTVGEYGKLVQGDPNSQEYKDQFIGEVARLLKDDVYWNERSELAKQNIYNRHNSFGTYYWDWKAIAQEWDKYFRKELKQEVLLTSTAASFSQLDDKGAFDYINANFKDYMQDEQEILWAMKSAREFMDKPLDTIVEIGLGYGANTGMLSRLLSAEGRVIGIDPCDEPHLRIQTELLEPILPNDNFKLIRDKSQDPGALNELQHHLAGKKIDLLFIDGSHTYEDSLADWNNMFPFMADKSVVAFHDVGNQSLTALEVGCVRTFKEISESHTSDKLVNANSPRGVPLGIGMIFLDRTKVPESNSLKKVTCFQVLEDVSWRDSLKTLEQIWETLKPGGQVEMLVPDLYTRTKQLFDGRKNIYEMADMLYGWQDSPKAFHKAAFTQSSVRSLLARAGFSVLNIHSEGDNLRAIGKKPEHLDKYAICEIAKRRYEQEVTYPGSLGGQPYNIHGETTIQSVVESPELSVVVLACKRKDMCTVPCVEAIKRNIGDIRYELLGIDDGSEDGTKEFFLEQANMTTVLTPRQGMTVAVNAGIAATSAPYICTVWNDVNIPENMIKPMLEYIREHPDCGMITGWFDEWKQPKSNELVMLLPNYLEQERAINVYIPGLCRIYSREAFAHAAPFDPFLYNMWEDHDSALAVQACGYKIAALAEPEYNHDPPKNILGDPSLHTLGQHIRRFLTLYYVHLKWNYKLDANWFLSTKAEDYNALGGAK